MSEPNPSRHLSGSAVLADPLVRELLDARIVGVLACLDAGGDVHAVPMWYAATDETIVLATSSRSRKARCLETNPRATLVLHDSRPGFEVCGASIAARVEVVGGAEADSLVDLVHSRYVTAEGQTAPTVREFLESDDVSLLLRPVSCLTWDERGSTAAEALRSRGGALPLVPTEPRA